ncbi:MAG: ABC transporter substrate-binding protein [Dehalococcoidales bacterium]|nr:ABC transporter substrate-binding protein [Dehalococcoidales bacterium]
MSTKRWLILTLLVIIISSLLLAGCGEKTSAPAASPATTANPPAATTKAPSQAPPASSAESASKYGGTLKVGFPELDINKPGYPPTMVNSSHVRACLEGLFYFDEHLNLQPQLSTGWEVASDFKSIMINLRKGVKFHDGSDFNAEVVKWNLDNYKASPKADLNSVTSIDVIDDYAVQLNLSSYDSLLISNLASSDVAIMVSKKAFEDNGQEWMEEHLVGTGPFKFASWDKDVALRLERFDDYWGGKPYLDGFQLIAFADQTTATIAFQKGEVDILHCRMVADANDLASKGFNVVQEPTGPCPFLVGDSTHPDSPYANIKVRQAISYAIDVPSICKGLGLGYWPSTNQWAYPGSPYFNDDVVGYPYNPEKAKQLLAEAGYSGGLNTKLNYLSLELTTPQVTAIQGYLKEVGINAELVPAEFGKFSQVGTAGEGWENGMWQIFVPYYPDMLSTIQYLMSPGVNRFVSFERPSEAQDVMAQALQATTVEAKNTRVRELNKLLVDKYCMGTWLWIQTLSEVKQSWVKDDKYGETPQGYVSSKAWLDK